MEVDKVFWLHTRIIRESTVVFSLEMSIFCTFQELTEEEDAEEAPGQLESIGRPPQFEAKALVSTQTTNTNVIRTFFIVMSTSPLLIDLILHK